MVPLDDMLDMWTHSTRRYERTQARTIGGTRTSSPASLTLSLIFGAGQVIVGGAVAYRLFTHSEWRRLKLFALLLIALWFIASGVTELFVSGMETSHDVRGIPSAAGFALWRGRADTVLIAVSIILVAVFVVAIAVRQFRAFQWARHVPGDDRSR